MAVKAKILTPPQNVMQRFIGEGWRMGLQLYRQEKQYSHHHTLPPSITTKRHYQISPRSIITKHVVTTVSHHIDNILYKSIYSVCNKPWWLIQFTLFHLVLSYTALTVYATNHDDLFNWHYFVKSHLIQHLQCTRHAMTMFHLVLPNTACTVYATSHDGFNQWTNILVLHSSLSCELVIHKSASVTSKCHGLIL